MLHGSKFCHKELHKIYALNVYIHKIKKLLPVQKKPGKIETHICYSETAEAWQVQKTQLKKYSANMYMAEYTLLSMASKSPSVLLTRTFNFVSDKMHTFKSAKNKRKRERGKFLKETAIKLQ